MKKCPKCGTILDDTKKKCYMCGSDIQLKPQIDFMNGFDDQIGAAVTKSQDNVFNSVPDISVKVNEVVEKSNNNATFTSGSKPADFFQNQMNSLNSMQYDERTAIEKIFSNDSRFRSKDEINADEAMKKNNRKVDDNPFFSADDLVNNKKNNKTSQPEIMPNPMPSNNVPEIMTQNNVVPPVQQAPVMEVPQIQAQPVMQQNVSQAQPVKKEKKKKEKVKKEKPAINWGNNLQKNNSDEGFSFFKNKSSQKFNINASFIFNTICFVLFASALIVMYFRFRNDPEKSGYVSMGGLNYKIDDDFKLKTNDTFSKYYTHGDNCVVRISYGETTNADSFVDNYFDDVQSDYSAEDGYITQKNEMKINDNTWTEITVAELVDNPASTGGYAVSAKYRFVTMVYKGNFYEIRYVNLDGNNDCSAMYDDLLDSLEFD